MKQKYLFGRISGIALALVFAIVFAGCKQEYNGPSADEIANAVIGKQPKPPTPGEIAEEVINKQPPLPTSEEIAIIVTERQEVNSTLRWLKEHLEYSGRLEIVKDIQAWGESDAAYTLTVNTAERLFFDLPVNSALTWAGDGTADIKRLGNRITFAEKSDGKTAAFDFTIINTVDQERTLKGTLTVTSDYDNRTVGTANLNEFFEQVLSYRFSSSDNNAELTTVIPISLWGQTDAAYTITAENSVEVYFPASRAPVLYDFADLKWEICLVEWRPPDVPGELDPVLSTTGGFSNINIGEFPPYSNLYDDMKLKLSTDSPVEKQAVLNFRITRGIYSISGTVTVKIKQVEPGPPDPAVQEQEALEKLKGEFDEGFAPGTLTGVLTRYTERGITNFGQNDVSYIIAIRGDQTQNDEIEFYRQLLLPKMSDDGEPPVNKVTWTATQTSNNAPAVLNVVIDPALKIYFGKSGVAVFNFIYTYSAGRTVSGTLTVVVLP